MNRNTILIIVIIVLCGASGLVLYRSFNPGSLLTVPETVSGQDVIIRNQADRLEVRIKKAIKKVESGGSLDALAESDQFRELETRYLRDITVDAGGRSNPFLPVEREGVDL